MIIDMHQDENTVVVTGTVPHLQSLNLDLERHDQFGGLQNIEIAGFTVTKVGAGRHDGHPARIFTLADDMGAREIGRLIVRNDAGREEALEWLEVYESEEAAQRRVDEWKAEKESPIATATVDFAWSPMFPSLEMGMATTAAEYGVSVVKHGDNGGGGWPEIKVTGLREKVRHLLRKGWDYSDEMITDAIGDGS